MTQRPKNKDVIQALLVRTIDIYTNMTVSCMYARKPRGYADHPEDEQLHHTITRTHERFDLWRFIIIRLLITVLLLI